MRWTTIKHYLLRYRQVLVFGVMGGCNTLLHSGTVVFLVERAVVTPVPANIAGFAIANTFSYFANARLTFKQAPSWLLYRRFLLVSMGSLILTLAFSSLAEYLHWHYLVGLAMVILCGPILTFALHKGFTFNRSSAP